MKNGRVIYQCFDRSKTLMDFPYPPVFVEKGVDYICFSIDRSVVSTKYWRMIYVADYKETTILPCISEYVEQRKLETNQIQTAPFFEEGYNKYPAICTIPELNSIPDVDFDATKIISTSDGHGGYVYKENPVYSDGMYEGRPFLLSIGVPVSNQIDTIDRCLSHIKPLLDELDSELLAVDTGSTDGTVEVCKQYGARIVEFPWCDNMSAARNTGIYNAKGLWYMSIDDDEWFEDVSEIIHFFKSGEYKKYDMATYVQRNYSRMSGQVYSDFSTLRMAKIIPKLHFEGRIHDAIVNPEMKKIRIYAFGSYAHHYGFVQDNRKRLNNKYKRNTSILLHDVYEYPMNLRYNFQLANELNVIGHYEDAVAFFVRGLSMAIHMGSDTGCKDHIIKWISTLRNKESEMVFYVLELFEDKYDFCLAERADFYYARMELGLKFAHPYEEIVDSYKKYEHHRKLFEKAPFDERIGVFSGVSACTVKEYINDAHVMAFCAYMGMGDFVEAEKMLSLIDVKGIYAKKKEFFEYIYMNDAILNKVLGYFSAVERNASADDFILGFVRYIERGTVEVCDFEKLAYVLMQFSVRSIQKVLDECKADIGQGFWDKVGTDENISIAENISDLPVQIKFFFAHLTKKRYLETEEETVNMDVFLKYMHIASDFTQAFYSSALLADEYSDAIEPELRAALLVWSGCNETNILQMIKKLKGALEICPLFHKEIKSLLQILDVTV